MQKTTSSPPNPRNKLRFQIIFFVFCKWFFHGISTRIRVGQNGKILTVWILDIHPMLQWDASAASQGKTGALRIVKFGAFELFWLLLKFWNAHSPVSKNAPCVSQNSRKQFLLCSYVETSNDTALDLFVQDAWNEFRNIFSQMLFLFGDESLKSLVHAVKKSPKHKSKHVCWGLNSL